MQLRGEQGAAVDRERWDEGETGRRTPRTGRDEIDGNERARVAHTPGTEK